MVDYSSDSYNAGRTGGAYQPGYNYDDYKKGYADKQADSQTFADSMPKANVDGATFGIMVMSPILFLFYPVLGLTIWAGFGLAGLVGAFAPIHPAIKLLVGIGLCIASWMPGFRLEKKVSQIKIYRFVRWIVRSAVAAALATFVLTSNKFSGPGAFFLLLLLIPYFLICRTFDRLYFPVWAQVERMQAMKEQGIPDKRSRTKRILYSLLWLLPYLALYNIVIALGSMLLSEDREAARALTEQYKPYILVVMYGSWLLFCILGVLPGTRKTRKSFIDHEVLLANRDSES